MKRIKIIGLTGQSGSGKSTVSEYFKKRNITVINADKLVREIYNANSPCVKTIAATFGDDVLDKNGEIIRPILAQKAFSSREATIKLNTVVHPFVTYEFLKQVNRALKNGEKYVGEFKGNLTGNAATANKLTTARTINVKVGGTSGTAQSFDGSSNITIPVSGMGEAYLTWGGKNISGDISPIDAAASL